MFGDGKVFTGGELQVTFCLPRVDRDGVGGHDDVAAVADEVRFQLGELSHLQLLSPYAFLNQVKFAAHRREPVHHLDVASVQLRLVQFMELGLLEQRVELVVDAVHLGIEVRGPDDAAQVSGELGHPQVVPLLHRGEGPDGKERNGDQDQGHRQEKHGEKGRSIDTHGNHSPLLDQFRPGCGGDGGEVVEAAVAHGLEHDDDPFGAGEVTDQVGQVGRVPDDDTVPLWYRGRQQAP